MKHKKHIILVLFIIITLITIFLIFKLLKIRNINNNETNVQMSKVEKEDRILWNEFLNRNPYLSQIDYIPENHEFMKESDMVKIALTSDNVETERIIREEIEQNYLLTEGDGYKKSKEAISKYLKELLEINSLEFNMIDTYIEDESYLINGEDYVYFTKIELPEKIYIAMNYKVENENYEVEIYEYNVTEENKDILNEMLDTGNIDANIEISSKYILKGEISGENITINTKEAI